MFARQCWRRTRILMKPASRHSNKFWWHMGQERIYIWLVLYLWHLWLVLYLWRFVIVMMNLSNGKLSIRQQRISTLILIEVLQPWLHGAKVVWERSLSTHNLRYRWMTCDGDSKAFSNVENTYPDCKVEKLDCVGHVQKRMGKHLLKLKAETKEKS